MKDFLNLPVDRLENVDLGWGHGARLTPCFCLTSGCGPHGAHDLVGRVVEVVRRNHVEAGVPEDFLAEVDVCALEAHDQRNLETDLLHRGDNTLGNDVAAHDSTENVDENAFHVRIGSDDFERCGDFVLGGAPANVEKVRRTFPIELDDVHRRHGEAGPVNHAAN